MVRTCLRPLLKATGHGLTPTVATNPQPFILGPAHQFILAVIFLHELDLAGIPPTTSSGTNRILCVFFIFMPRFLHGTLDKCCPWQKRTWEYWKPWPLKITVGPGKRWLARTGLPTDRSQTEVEIHDSRDRFCLASEGCQAARKFNKKYRRSSSNTGEYF